MNAELLELLTIAKHAASLAAAVHRRALVAGDIKVDTKRSVHGISQPPLRLRRRPEQPFNG